MADLPTRLLPTADDVGNAVPDPAPSIAVRTDTYAAPTARQNCALLRDLVGPRAGHRSPGAR